MYWLRKVNISVPTDEQTEAQRKEAHDKAKEEIAKSGSSGESANRMIQAMANLSADEIEDDGTYDVLIITNLYK